MMSIEVEAYLLWEKAGCPEGRAEYFWHLAEKKEKLAGKSIRQISKVVNIPRTTIQDRLKRGIPLEKAISLA